MPRSIGETCRAVMLQIALAQPCPDERRALLTIMHDDGWLTGAEFALLCAERRAA